MQVDPIEESAQEVHDTLGSGFTESVYHKALGRELSERGIAHHSEGTIPVMYRGAPVGRRRPDMFVVTDDESIVVELKAGSSSGSSQLEQYLSMATEDDNLEQIVGGVVIRFNDCLEIERHEVGAEDSEE